MFESRGRSGEHERALGNDRDEKRCDAGRRTDAEIIRRERGEAPPVR
jgi:hypothetical protein